MNAERKVQKKLLRCQQEMLGHISSVLEGYKTDDLPTLKNKAQWLIKQFDVAASIYTLSPTTDNWSAQFKAKEDISRQALELDLVGSEKLNKDEAIEFFELAIELYGKYALINDNGVAKKIECREKIATLHPSYDNFMKVYTDCVEAGDNKRAAEYAEKAAQCSDASVSQKKDAWLNAARFWGLVQSYYQGESDKKLGERIHHGWDRLSPEQCGQMAEEYARKRAEAKKNAEGLS